MCLLNSHINYQNNYNQYCSDLKLQRKFHALHLQQNSNGQQHHYLKTELILYYVLKTHQGFDVWAGLSKDWKKRKETAYALNFEMDNLTTKNFKEVCERIKAGLDETGMETKNSLDIITENMNGIIADPTRLGKTKLEEVFNQEVILHVCDTGKRRQWYLYRLLSLVVIGQIEKFCRDIQSRNSMSAG